MTSDNSESDSTRSYTAIAVGAEVQQYTVLSKIGAGGMGEVYLAQDNELRRQVALKFLPTHLCQDDDCRKRFKREAQAAAKLDHPNIVAIHEVSDFDGRPFFAMAHVEGRSVRDVIKEGKLSVAETLDWIRQICEGLQHAHAAGVVHRDIKPGNIMVDRARRLRILDFGLATVSGEEKLTKTGSTLGTVGYMSPEQIEGKQVDQRSDIFSVGVILYEMLTGHRPFEGDNDAAVARAITDSTPDPVARYKSGTTGQLQQIVDKALSKDPALRYQTAADMLADLRRLDIGEASGRRRRAMLWAGSAAVVLVSVFVVFTLFGTHRVKPAGPKRLVVLPFDNLGRADQDYFVAGITEEVISRLSEIGGLSVVSRISAARMKRGGEDVKAIGKELAVEFILDASVRLELAADSGRHVRVTAQLIHVAEDKVIWSHTYDTVMAEMFAVQANIAEQVAERMNVVLLQSERKAVWERWTKSPEAWEFNQRAAKEAYRYGGYGETALRTGLALYLKTIELDSTFVLPYSAISDVYGRLYQFGFDRSDSIKELSLRYAERAGELSSSPKIKYWPLGRYYAQVAHDHKKALEYYEKAYAGNKNDVGYLNYAHHVLRRMGRWDEAYDYMRRVLDNDPNVEWHLYDLAVDCVAMRRYTEAESLYQRVLALSPGYDQAYFGLEQVYVNWHAELGKARAVIKQSAGYVTPETWNTELSRIAGMEGDFARRLRLITIPPLDTIGYHLSRGMAFRTQGHDDSARAEFEAMRLLYDRNRDRLDDAPFLSMSFAQMFAGLGDREQAVKLMANALDVEPHKHDAIAHADLLIASINTYMILGDVAMQLSVLDSLLSKPSDVGLGGLIVDPDYREMVQSPGFRKIMETYADSVQWDLYNRVAGSG